MTGPKQNSLRLPITIDAYIRLLTWDGRSLLPALAAKFEERLADRVAREGDGVGDSISADCRGNLGEISGLRRIPLDGAYLILSDASLHGGDCEIAICLQENHIDGEEARAPCVHFEILSQEVENLDAVIRALAPRPMRPAQKSEPNR